MQRKYLADAPIRMTAVQAAARSVLVHALDAIPGEKALVIERDCMKLLGLVAEFPLFKEHGARQIFHLEKDAPPPFQHIDASSLVFFVRGSNVQALHTIAQHVQTLHHQLRQAALSQQQQHSHRKSLAPSDQPPSHAAAAPSSARSLDVYVYLAPRRTMLAERIFEERGVLGQITLASLPIDLVPLDRDVLTMAYPMDTVELLQGDRTVLHQMATALHRLQKALGFARRVHAVGRYAHMIKQSVQSMLQHFLQMQKYQTSSGSFCNTDDDEDEEEEDGDEESDLRTGDIDQIILIDRTIDMMTPFCQQLTYEGLIDEILHLNHGCVELPGKSSKEKVQLNAGTPLYGTLRDQPFSSIGRALNELAKKLTTEAQSRHGRKSVQELKDYMSRMGGIMSEQNGLQLQTTLAELITPLTRTTEFQRHLELEHHLLAADEPPTDTALIDDLIDDQKPLFTILRLLSLWSLTANGIRPKLYDHYVKDITHVYGTHALVLLHTMRRCKLIYPASAAITKSAFSFMPSARGSVSTTEAQTFSQLRDTMLLLPGDADQSDSEQQQQDQETRRPLTGRSTLHEHRKDVASLYAGYAPLTLRIIESILQDKRIAAHAIPFKTITQHPPSRGPSLTSTEQRESPSKKVTLVIFIGGVTHAELSGCRYLSKQYHRPIVMATSSTLRAESLIHDLDTFSKQSLSDYTTASASTSTSAAVTTPG